MTNMVPGLGLVPPSADFLGSTPMPDGADPADIEKLNQALQDGIIIQVITGMNQVINDQRRPPD